MELIFWICLDVGQESYYQANVHVQKRIFAVKATYVILEPVLPQQLVPTGQFRRFVCVMPNLKIRDIVLTVFILTIHNAPMAKSRPNAIVLAIKRPDIAIRLTEK